MAPDMNNNPISAAAEPPDNPRPVVLLMIDGWGVSKTRDNNAIRLAKIPNFKKIVAHYPATILCGGTKKDSLNYIDIGAGASRPRKEFSLSRILAAAGKWQLKIAETEKFALVTEFFDNSDQPCPQEDQVLIPSALLPDESKFEMATREVVKKMIKAIKSDKYDFILASLANVDNLNNAGNFSATIAAIEFIDKTLKKIIAAVLARGGILIISSAHGYAEEVFDIQTEAVNKENTANPVPFIVVGEKFMGRTIGFAEAPGNDLSLLEPAGSIIDIAPTILTIMGLKKPPEMDGQSLI